MQEFLVEIVLEGTDSVALGDLEELRLAEAARATDLAAEGTLLRLWRTDSTGWRNVGLWRARSERDLRGTIASLPLARFMSVSVRRLGAHPNDPGTPRLSPSAARDWP